MFYRGGGVVYNKGYCHVDLFDIDTYHAILETQVHMLGSRRIYCSAFISGRRLTKYNNLSNLRRIIVTGIPDMIKEVDLYSIFGHFGKVSMAYIYTSPYYGLYDRKSSPTASI